VTVPGIRIENTNVLRITMNILLSHTITNRKPETEALTTPVAEEKLSALLIEATQSLSQ